MNQSASHSWSSPGRPIGSAWGTAARNRRRGARIRARGVMATLGLLLKGLAGAIAVMILVGINLLAGLAAILLGVLALPLLLFGAMLAIVLLINVVSWLFQALGLL